MTKEVKVEGNNDYVVRCPPNASLAHHLPSSLLLMVLDGVELERERRNSNNGFMVFRS